MHLPRGISLLGSPLPSLACCPGQELSAFLCATTSPFSENPILRKDLINSFTLRCK